MTVTMIDSALGMKEMLEAQPARWEEATCRMWQPMAGMYFFVPGGPDLAAVHLQNYGFGPGAPSQKIQRAIHDLERAHAWQRIEQALKTGLDELTSANPGLLMPDLTVLLVLGDPMNRHFMDDIRGLSAFGGISGYIVIALWPTEEVLGRLEGIALHELHHNVRYSPGGIVWNPQTVTVGEHVVAEGLAELFAVQMVGGKGLTHFVSEETRTSEEVLRRVAEGLGVTGMQEFAAWVLGDSSARLTGARPVGLPMGAGYAAGARIVRAYLDATDRTAASSVTASVAEILAAGLPQLGLESPSC